MKESSTYQAILEEGRAQGALAEAKKILRLQGDAAFGPPDAATAAAIERFTDLARVERPFPAEKYSRLKKSLRNPNLNLP